MTNSVPIVSPSIARTLLLEGQGLLSPDDRSCSASDLYRDIERLGFVQLDSISVVERAHHHILATRFQSYSPELLERLHRSGKLFEHITHDVSLIPTRWFPHWRHRFLRAQDGAWFRNHLGARPGKIINAVHRRIEREGPLMARDFESPAGAGGPWWQWKPAKAALEYLWRAGDLAVAQRRQFQKVYDLTERVLPKVHALPAPDEQEHVAWACRTALDRLGVATVPEIAAFWKAISLGAVKRWLEAAVKCHEAVPVRRLTLTGASSSAFAVPDWQDRARRAPAAPGHMRLLSPFDPLIRDRRRCLDLFGFDYRFEAFVPKPRRKYGYYVLPMLAGEDLVGRLDPKLDRARGVLSILGVWWEPKVKVTKARRRALHDALDRYAAFVGARRWELK